MRKKIIAFAFAAIAICFINSCTTISHGSATCPSHDPNYFRKGQ